MIFRMPAPPDRRTAVLQRVEVTLDGVDRHFKLSSQTFRRDTPRAAATQHLGQSVQPFGSLHSSDLLTCFILAGFERFVGVLAGQRAEG